MKIFAIDPGCTESAYVIWDASDKTIYQYGKNSNGEMLNLISIVPEHVACEAMVIEQIASYGMAVGAEVFETCVWTGRFWQEWKGRVHRIKRMDVKMNLCGHPRANDSNIRQALIDRFGPVGTKNAPGKLYGVTGDVWAALAVAVTFADKQKIPSAPSKV